MLHLLRPDSEVEGDRGARPSGPGIQADVSCLLVSSSLSLLERPEEDETWEVCDSGMASHGNCVYVVGGRENLYTGDGLEVRGCPWELSVVPQRLTCRETGSTPWPRWSTASPGHPWEKTDVDMTLRANDNIRRNNNWYKWYQLSAINCTVLASPRNCRL